MGTFLTNMNKKEIHSPIAQSIQSQLYSGGKNGQNQSSNLETPPAKQ